MTGAERGGPAGAEHGGPAGAEHGGTEGAEQGGPDVPARPTNPVLWPLGLAVWVVEILVVGFGSMLFGGLSAMLSDSCYTDSTELICEPQWQTIMAFTAITALLVTVIVMGVIMVLTRKLWTLGLAIALTLFVPLVAFMVMQAIVTA